MGREAIRRVRWCWNRVEKEMAWESELGFVEIGEGGGAGWRLLVAWSGRFGGHKSQLKSAGGLGRRCEVRWFGCLLLLSFRVKFRGTVYKGVL
jgi:hypothetical protein